MMKRLLLILLLLSCTANAATKWCTKYGSNTSPWDTPTKGMTTIAQVNSNASAGDTIFFGAGIWSGVTLIPVAGTAGDPTVYACSAFVSGYPAKIYAATEITGWSVYSGEIYTSSTSGITANDVIFNGEYNLWNNSSSSLARGEFWRDASSIRVRLKDGSNPATLGVWKNSNSGDQQSGATVGSYTNSPSRPLFAVLISARDYVTLWGLELKYGNHQTIAANEGCNNITISHCKIGPATGMGNVNPGNIYTTGGNPNSDFLVRACSIGTCVGLDGADPVTEWGSCITMYAWENAVVESCTFYGYQTFAGIYNKNDVGTDHDSVVIRYNTFDIDDTMSVWATNNQHFGKPLIALFRSQNREWIYGNTFKNHRNGRGVCIFPGTATDEHFYVFNNTFINVGEPFTTLWTSSLGTTRKRDCQFKYNVICGSPWSNVTLYDADLGSPTGPTVIDYNVYYVNSDTFKTSSSPSTYAAFDIYTWSQWQALGWDVNSDETLDSTDQDFNSIATGDYSRPSAGSEMSVTYGGRTWTRFGALQGDPPACADTLVAPVFVSPDNGATGMVNGVIIDWSDSTQVGTVDWYDYLIATNTSGSPDAVTASTTDSKDTITAALSASELYYWRVRGRTDCDTSAWSGYRSFTMSACPDTLANPSLSSPANGATNQVNTLTLDWADITGANYYQWQMDNNSDYSSITDSGSSATSTATTNKLFASTTYYWRARGNGCDTSAWSASRTFTAAASESCQIIASLPYTASGDSCYCLLNRKMTTTGNAVTISGHNARLINRTESRDTLDFGTDGGDNYEGVTVTSKNVTIDGLYIRHRPVAPVDSAKDNICIYAVDADSLKVFRTKLLPAGMNGRGFQNNSGGHTFTFWRITADSSGCNSFVSRCSHDPSCFYLIPDSADGANGRRFFSMTACSIYSWPHNIVASTDGPRSRPLFNIDSNDFSVDARNVLYAYPDGQSNACHSTGDAAAIDILGAGAGSRISYNKVRSGTTYEGGHGFLLQNLMGSSSDSIKIFGNDVESSSGPNDIHGMGLAWALYFRYVPGTANTGSQYVSINNNKWKMTLDCDTATGYRGREGETWSLILSGFGGGANDADSFRHISFADNYVEQVFTGTPSGGWEGSALGYASGDSTDAAYSRNGNIVFKDNHYIGVRQAIEFGNMRGVPGNGFLSITDTIDLTQDSDSAICFDRTGSYTYHSRGNRILDAIYAGYATDLDFRFDTGNNTGNDTLGESVVFQRTLRIYVLDSNGDPVVGADAWAWNSYNDTVLTGTTNGSGYIEGVVDYKFESYDKFTDTYVLSDSAFNDFTLKGKSGTDSAQVIFTITSTAAQDSVQFSAPEPPVVSPMKVMQGITIRGVTIK